MRGYIVVPGNDDMLDMIFYGEVGGQLVEMAPLLHSRQCSTERRLAGRTPRPFAGLPASASPNVVVLPPDERHVIFVYILTPAEEAGVYPLGGH